MLYIGTSQGNVTNHTHNLAHNTFRQALILLVAECTEKSRMQCDQIEGGDGVDTKKKVRNE